MGKKKKDKRKKSEPSDLAALVERLQKENEELRARLEKIAELTEDLPGDDEDDEEEERLIADPAAEVSGSPHATVI